MSDLKPFLETLRSRIVISEIIGSSVLLHKKGRIHKGLCPFHKEKTPSFNVDDLKGFYHCFGCGVHGDAITFVMETKNMPFLDAVDYLASIAGIQRPKFDKPQPKQDKSLFEVMHATTIWFQQQLKLSAGYRAYNYLKQRGLSDDSIAKFSLGYAPSSGLQQVLIDQGFKLEQLIKAGLVINPDNGRTAYERFRDRIIFPIKDLQGRVIAFGGRILTKDGPKYLNSPETELFSKKQLLYNLQTARQEAKNQSLLVVEGYTDVIALDQAGIKTAIAPLGTALTEEQIQLLWRTDKNPVLCFDGDVAGRGAAIRAANRALPELVAGKSLQFCFLPDGEDPDSYLSKHGVKAFNNLIEAAKPLSDVLWEEFLEQTPLNTPEAKAGARTQLKTTLANISDPNVQHFYAMDFQNRLNQEIFNKNKYHQNRRNSMDLAGRRPHLNYKSFIGHKILLATLINHPKLVDEVLDRLLDLELTDKTLNKIREILVDSTEKDNVTCKELWQKISDSSELKSFMEELSSDRLVIHASFVAQQIDDQTALSGWQDVWYRTHVKPEVKNDIASAVRDMKSSFDLVSWERLKQLKQSETIANNDATEIRSI